MRAAIAGQGLVYGPRYIAAEAIRDGRLIEIDLGADPVEMGAVHSVTPARRRLPARVRAWLDFLGDRIPAIAEEW